MKKYLLLFLLSSVIAPLAINAQQGYFGYISFNKTVQLMPEYMEAQLKLEELQSEYREEVERSKREFDRQYTDFMINQDQLSSTIVAKRQKELQLLMDNNVLASKEYPTIAILDGIEDPHNLGAIIRTAEAAGVHGIIIPKRRSASLNYTVGKTSAGALEYMKVARVTNIANEIDNLKKNGEGSHYSKQPLP